MNASATPRRGGSLLLVVAAALLVVLLTALGASSPRPPLVEVLPAPALSVHPQSAPPVSVSPLPSQSPLFPMPPQEPMVLPDWFGDAVVVLSAAAVLALIVTFFMRVSGAMVRTRRRQATEPTGAEFDIPEIDDEELAETLTATVASLRHGVPVDGAIVECWRRLERVAADSGIPRRPSQTSHEFTAEVLSHAVVDSAAISELAELYRQAMFSTHRLTDAHRDRAIAALEAISAQLRRTPS